MMVRTPNEKEETIKLNITLHKYTIIHDFISLYITLYQHTLLYITVHYIISTYITLYHHTLLYINIHYFISPYITLYHHTLLYITIHYLISPYITLHNYTTLHYYRENQSLMKETIHHPEFPLGSLLIPNDGLRTELRVNKTINILFI